MSEFSYSVGIDLQTGLAAVGRSLITSAQFTLRSEIQSSSVRTPGFSSDRNRRRLEQETYVPRPGKHTGTDASFANSGAEQSRLSYLITPWKDWTGFIQSAEIERDQYPSQRPDLHRWVWILPLLPFCSNFRYLATPFYSCPAECCSNSRQRQTAMEEKMSRRIGKNCFLECGPGVLKIQVVGHKVQDVTMQCFVTGHVLHTCL